MPDSDDLLIENSLKPLLKKALETKVDLVVSDFLSMTDEEIDDFDLAAEELFASAKPITLPPRRSMAVSKDSLVLVLGS